MFSFEVNWNRKLAAEGKATAAFTVEMIRANVLGNFVSIPKCKAGNNGPWPTLPEVLALGIGECLSGYCTDETGRLTWSITNRGN